MITFKIKTYRWYRDHVWFSGSNDLFMTMDCAVLGHWKWLVCNGWLYQHEFHDMWTNFLWRWDEKACCFRDSLGREQHL